jgi:GR25 family glycosyltransferase involved in LPS biosynthesis
MIPSFCIVLEKDEPEWPLVRHRIQQYPYFSPLHKWKATLGNTLDELTLEELLTPRAKFDLLKPRCAHEDLGSKNAVGCYLSHVRIWKHIVEQNIPIAAIFEDDVRFLNMSDFVPAYQSLPTSWDLFLFGYLKLNQKPLEENTYLYKSTGYFWGLQSYLITYEGAKKLLEKSFPLDCQLDAYIGSRSKQVNIFFAKRNMTQQIRKSSQTNIQTSGIKHLLPRDPSSLIALFVGVALLGGFIMLFLYIGGKKVFNAKKERMI